MICDLKEVFAICEGSEAQKLDGFDDCIVGIGSRCGQPDLLVYDFDKIIQKLQDEGQMSYDEALEYYEFNILGAWAGEGTPIILETVSK